VARPDLGKEGSCRRKEPTEKSHERTNNIGWEKGAENHRRCQSTRKPNQIEWEKEKGWEQKNPVRERFAKVVFGTGWESRRGPMHGPGGKSTVEKERTCGKVLRGDIVMCVK